LFQSCAAAVTEVNQRIDGLEQLLRLRLLLREAESRPA